MYKRIVAVGVTALAVAGCGSATHHPTPLKAFAAGYERDKASFNAVGQQLTVDLQTAANTSNAKLREEFALLAAQAGEAQSQLRALKPTSAYRVRLDQLIGDFTPVKADLSAVAAAAAAGNGTAAKRATEKVVKDSASLKAVDDSLTNALYFR
jgi:hypothetical protein